MSLHGAAQERQMPAGDLDHIAIATETPIVTR
jgi:hypothetical protein